MRRYLSILFVIVVAFLGFFGFQGKTSKEPPVYVFDDMDYQSKYKPQGENKFFADGRDARLPVAGSVARGNGLEPNKVFADDYRYTAALNPSFVTGKDAQGQFLVNLPEKSLDLLPTGELKPFNLDAKTFETGRTKYQIYCAVCHGVAADGNGIMKVRSAVEGDVAINTIANLQAALYRDYPAGQIFDVITHGKNTMQGYGDKLSPEERWSVIAYLRALQLSQSFPGDLIPANVKNNIK
jgi:mono/diheme cytochrome c family protein